MILLRKTNFTFDKILKEGYHIKEQPNVINKVQFANGNRKKVMTAYTDVVIKIDLGCFDGDTTAEYLSKLTDGAYQYYSLNDKVMKSANFIVTKPELTVDLATSEVYIKDFTVTLEKSSDL